MSYSNWTKWSKYNSGSNIIARVISKSDEREARSRYEITTDYKDDYSLNCATRGPITN